MSRAAATGLALSLALAVGMPAFAQMPFDMSPELGQRDFPLTPGPAPAVETPALRPETAEPAVPAAEDVVVSSAFERPILPLTGVRLEGEVARRALLVYLTAAQAAAPASLTLDPINAIVVAPESSELEVLVNGVVIAAVPINYPAGDTPITVDLPENVLVAGTNTFVLRASQRHRTDCSVLSTYELWTELHTAGTMLRLEGEDLGRIAAIEDIPAVGFGADGATRFAVTLPQAAVPEARGAALSAIQTLALLVGSPAIDVAMEPELLQTPTGTLNVVIATADSLPESASSVAEQAGRGPVATMLAEDGSNTLVLSGPDWPAVARALDVLAAGIVSDPVDRAGSRLDLARTVPLVTGENAIPLAALGVETAEFNGRRYHADFSFSLPSDFFANEYGEAALVLDAAYSSDVLPGSQLDVYVNGQIAAVFPILTTDGGAFRNSRLRIPMTNFRPGINEMDLEAVLLTAQDEQCAPGLTGRAAPRFLFSSGSELDMPDFARIAQYPDLSSFTGTAAPYRNAGAVPVVVSQEPETLRAAMLLLARTALSSGVSLPVTVTTASGLDPAAGALIVAPLAEIGEDLRDRIGVAEPVDPEFGVAGDLDTALEQWRQAAEPNNISTVDSVWAWLSDQLNLQPEDFWLLREADGAYVPQSSAAVILSQAEQPEGGIWTALTIPDAAALPDAVTRLVEPATWNEVGGRISAVAAGDDSVLVIEPQRTTFRLTAPLDVFNARLIAANWLSDNVLAYAVALALITVLLTALTSILLGRGSQRR